MRALCRNPTLQGMADNVAEPPQAIAIRMSGSHNMIAGFTVYRHTIAIATAQIHHLTHYQSVVGSQALVLWQTLHSSVV